MSKVNDTIFIAAYFISVLLCYGERMSNNYIKFKLWKTHHENVLSDRIESDAPRPER